MATKKLASMFGALAIALTLLFLLSGFLNLGQNVARAQDSSQNFTWSVQWAQEDAPSSYWTHTAMTADPAARIAEFFYYLHPGMIPGGGYYDVDSAGRSGLYKADPNHISTVDGLQIVWEGDSYSFLRSNWNWRACQQGPSFEYQRTEGEVSGSGVTIKVTNTTTQSLNLRGMGPEISMAVGAQQIFEAGDAPIVISLLTIDEAECATFTALKPRAVANVTTAVTMPLTATVGVPFSITWTVTNLGPDYANSLSRLYWPNGDYAEIGPTNLPWLDRPGSGGRMEFTWVFTETGVYTGSAEILMVNYAHDPDLSNNTVTFTVTVVAATPTPWEVFFPLVAGGPRE